METTPIDFTGRGPTGTGFRPTNSEMRRQAENRYRTDNVVSSMSRIDPDVRAASELSMRGFAKVNSPEAMRSYQYNSVAGQVAADGFMMARQAGVLGEGDPANYARNLVRGVTGGGFTTDIIGQSQGRSVIGTGQRVTGGGLLAERVSQSFAKNMVRDLYGEGSPDSRKLNGFNMEESSGVASTIMRRGGIGHAATVVQGADIRTRIDAARQAAQDSGQDDLAAKLAEVRAGTKEELEEAIKAANDPKLKAGLEGVKTSSVAVLVNKGASKKVADTVREVTKGMAALSDMYGELSAPELHQQLESITGIRITNKAQAKQANNMVENLRNGAESMGMDPRAFMDFVQQSKSDFQGRVSAANGLGERDHAESQRLNSNVHYQIALDSVAAANESQQTEVKAKELGWSGFEGTTKDASAIASDKKDRMEEMMTRFLPMAEMIGSVDRATDPENKKQMQELIEKFYASTDPAEKDAMTDRSKDLLGAEFGGPAQSYNVAHNSGAVKLGIEKAYNNKRLLDNYNDSLLVGNGLGDLGNIGENKMGLSHERSASLAAESLKHLGASGMEHIAVVAKQAEKVGDTTITADDRKKQMMDYMTKQAGMSAAAANDFIDAHMGADGKLKDETAYSEYVANMAQNFNGDKTTLSLRTSAEGRLAARSKNSDRAKVSSAGGGLGLAGIAKAIMEKKVGGVNTPEMLALTLGAMKKGGISSAKDDEGFDAMSQFDDNIDLSEGINSKALEQINKVNGSDTKLAEHLGYKSNEEMAEATKNDPIAMDAAYEAINKDYDLHLSGEAAHTTAISDRAAEAARNMKDGPAQRVENLEAVMRMNPKYKEGDQSASIDAAKTGSADQLSAAMGKQYKPDEAGAVTSDNSWWGKLWRKDARSYSHMANNQKFVDGADAVNSADPDQLKAYKRLDKDGELSDSYRKQIEALKVVQKGGADTIISEDGTTVNPGREIKNLEAAVARLTDSVVAGGAGGAGGVMANMTVTHMEVTNLKELLK